MPTSSTLAARLQKEKENFFDGLSVINENVKDQERVLTKKAMKSLKTKLVHNVINLFIEQIKTGETQPLLQIWKFAEEMNIQSQLTSVKQTAYPRLFNEGDSSCYHYVWIDVLFQASPEQFKLLWKFICETGQQQKLLKNQGCLLFKLDLESGKYNNLELLWKCIQKEGLQKHILLNDTIYYNTPAFLYKQNFEVVWKYAKKDNLGKALLEKWIKIYHQDDFFNNAMHYFSYEVQPKNHFYSISHYDFGNFGNFGNSLPDFSFFDKANLSQLFHLFDPLISILIELHTAHRNNLKQFYKWAKELNNPLDNPLDLSLSEQESDILSFKEDLERAIKKTVPIMLRFSMEEQQKCFNLTTPQHQRNIIEKLWQYGTKQQLEQYWHITNEFASINILPCFFKLENPLMQLKMARHYGKMYHFGKSHEDRTYRLDPIKASNEIKNSELIKFCMLDIYYAKNQDEIEKYVKYPCSYIKMKQKIEYRESIPMTSPENPKEMLKILFTSNSMIQDANSVAIATQYAPYSYKFLSPAPPFKQLGHDIFKYIVSFLFNLATIKIFFDFPFGRRFAEEYQHKEENEEKEEPNNLVLPSFTGLDNNNSTVIIGDSWDVMLT